MKETCLDYSKPLAKNLIGLSKELKAAFSAVASESLSADLGQTEHRVVGFICHHPGCISADLSEEFDFVRSTVSQMVNSLIAKGYVLSVISKEDKRKVLLYPSELALEQEDKARNLFDWFDNVVERGLTEEEKMVFLTIASKIEKNIKEAKKR